MYSYTYDRKTGGILLNSSPTGFSKEPRPVYATELDILGFNKYWKYDKQIELPYMWAEANTYWHRGVCVAAERWPLSHRKSSFDGRTVPVSRAERKRPASHRYSGNGSGKPRDA